MRKLTSLTLIIILVFASYSLAGHTRPWINTFHYCLGFYSGTYPVTQATLDSMATQYDFLVLGDDISATGISGPPACYLKDATDGNIILTRYTEHGATMSHAFDYMFFKAREMGYTLDEWEDMFLHFIEDASYNMGTTPTEDKFGARTPDWSGTMGHGIRLYDASAGTYTSITDVAYTGGSTAICQDDGDILYIGHYGMFKEVNFDFVTTASSDFAGTWQYYRNDGTWATLPMESDGTSDFTQSGQIIFDCPGQPSWADTLIDNETYIAYWIRFVVTNSGTTQPVVNTIKGENYITGTSPCYFPGWDPANDANGDGVRDNSSNPNATANFRWQARYKHMWGWNDKNTFFNLLNPDFQEVRKAYAVYLVSDDGDDHGCYDGYYGDDWAWDGIHISDWDKLEIYSEYSSEAEADSMYQVHFVTPLAQITRDALVEDNMPDTLVGGNTSELVSIDNYYPTGPTNAPMHYQLVERYCDYGRGGPEVGNQLDRFLTYPVTAAARGQTILCEYYYRSGAWDASVKPRWDNFSLASFYLISGPGIYYGDCRDANAWGMRQLDWISAIDYNIGQAVKPNDTLDPAWYIWDANNHIYARDFTNALVLVRFKPTWSSPVDSSTVQTFTLESEYRRLMSNGTLLAPSNQVSLLNSDGAVLIPPDGVLDTIPPAPIDDLEASTGSEDGEIDLAWTATGDDGNIGTAGSYLIKYSTETITEENWGSCTSYGSAPSPEASGEVQTFTLSGLSPGEEYRVAIVAYDDYYNPSEISNVATAVSGYSISLETDEVSLVEPASGSVQRTRRPTLVVANFDTSSSNYYDFELAEDSSFFDLVASSPAVTQQEGATTSWQVEEPLESGQLYFWQVTANDEYFSSIYNFMVEPAVYAYPNPFRMSEATQVTFTEIPAGSNLRLLTVSGGEVRRWSNNTGDDIVWDGTNKSGHPVGSDTYLWFVEGTDMQGKLVVIR